MFGFFKSKTADALNHWIAFVEGLHFPPAEFYERVEKELQTRQVPGMEMDRIEFSEGGVLSGKRLYLRMLRERLVFDVCAAPFGTSFFFSCRMTEIPLIVKPWQLLVLFLGFSICFWISVSVLTKTFGVSGLFLCPILWIVFIIVAVYTMRNSVAMGLKDLDRTLIQTPVIGPIYEAWFRKESYYRLDTRLMYLEIVSDVVKHLAEDAVAAKGLKFTKQYEQGQILGELYKPLRSSKEAVKSG
jgi:hypothetical protein